MQSEVSAVKLIKQTRGTYKSCLPKDRFKISKYASETCTTTAVRKLKGKFLKLNESTVRSFNKYLEHVKN